MIRRACFLRLATVALAAALLLPVSVAGAGEAKGTLTHKSVTVTLTQAYLVTGPDAVDPQKIIRRLILSAKDVGATIQACQSMKCVDGVVIEGLEVDFPGGPRLNVWMAINGGRVQYSGTEEPAVLKARVNEPNHLAGQLSFDATQMGGPRVEVQFDAALVKEFKAAR